MTTWFAGAAAPDEEGGRPREEARGSRRMEKPMDFEDRMGFIRRGGPPRRFEVPMVAVVVAVDMRISCGEKGGKRGDWQGVR